MNQIDISIHGIAHSLGFERIGFAKAEPVERVEKLGEWLGAGHGGTMTYLNRSAERRANPQLVLPGAKTVISVAQSYFTGRLPEEVRNDPSRGLIASYAWGRDYHEVLLGKLHELAEFVEKFQIENSKFQSEEDKTRPPEIGEIFDPHAPGEERPPLTPPKTGGEVRTTPLSSPLRQGGDIRCYVDTGHVMERDYGEKAGLGFIGKNTLLISPEMGSTFFIGEILTTLEIEPTLPVKQPSCGSCTKCLDICPTHAFPTAYVLNSNLCISYLTIEYKGSIPIDLRVKMGNHIFGCDDCQDCCPWNQRFSTLSQEKEYYAQIERQAPKLTTLARLTEAEFKEKFKGSAVLRPKYEGFMRNVAIALGNWGSSEAKECLQELMKHESELVREHAEWGMKQTGRL